VNSVETGKSGRILIQYSTGQEKEMLYLPPEYLWRTNEKCGFSWSWIGTERTKNSRSAGART
jgi:hypothetical protein